MLDLARRLTSRAFLAPTAALGRAPDAGRITTRTGLAAGLPLTTVGLGRATRVSAWASGSAVFAIIDAQENNLLGAQHAEGTGPVMGLHRFEQRLSAVPDINTLWLRAGYFMENLLAHIDTARAHHRISAPFEPDRLCPSSPPPTSGSEPERNSPPEPGTVRRSWSSRANAT
ncbi:hypothetical protein ACWC0A_23800 [Streptomyces scopuliridis]